MNNDKTIAARVLHRLDTERGVEVRSRDGAEAGEEAGVEVSAEMAESVANRVLVDGMFCWTEVSSWGLCFLRGLEKGERVAINSSPDRAPGIPTQFVFKPVENAWERDRAFGPTHLILGLRGDAAAAAFRKCVWTTKAGTEAEMKPLSPVPQAMPVPALSSPEVITRVRASSTAKAFKDLG